MVLFHEAFGRMRVALGAEEKVCDVIDAELPLAMISSSCRKLDFAYAL